MTQADNCPSCDGNHIGQHPGCHIDGSPTDNDSRGGMASEAALSATDFCKQNSQGVAFSAILLRRAMDQGDAHLSIDCYQQIIADNGGAGCRARFSRFNAINLDTAQLRLEEIAWMTVEALQTPRFTWCYVALPFVRDEFDLV
jgi:hypothetical protein